MAKVIQDDINFTLAAERTVINDTVKVVPASGAATEE